MANLFGFTGSRIDFMDLVVLECKQIQPFELARMVGRQFGNLSFGFLDSGENFANFRSEIC